MLLRSQVQRLILTFKQSKLLTHLFSTASNLRSRFADAAKKLKTSLFGKRKNLVAKSIEGRITLFGNDPEYVINEDDKQAAGDDKPIVLIGLSALRSLKLAIELANKNKAPKIIIVDTSPKVYAFWVNLKKIMATCICVEDFHKLTQNFVRQFKLENKEEQLIDFFNSLAGKYPWDYLQAIIGNLVVLKRSWADQHLFQSIKKVIDTTEHSEVYMFPSNVLYFVNSEECQMILSNIQLLQPRLTFYSNMTCRTGLSPRRDVHKPSASWSLSDCRPEKVLHELLAPNHVDARHCRGLQKKNAVFHKLHEYYKASSTRTPSAA